jgi:hypothetical protein
LRRRRRRCRATRSRCHAAAAAYLCVHACVWERFCLQQELVAAGGCGKWPPGRRWWPTCVPPGTTLCHLLTASRLLGIHRLHPMCSRCLHPHAHLPSPHMIAHRPMLTSTSMLPLLAPQEAPPAARVCAASAARRLHLGPPAPRAAVRQRPAERRDAAGRPAGGRQEGGGRWAPLAGWLAVVVCCAVLMLCCAAGTAAGACVQGCGRWVPGGWVCVCV